MRYEKIIVKCNDIKIGSVYLLDSLTPKAFELLNNYTDIEVLLTSLNLVEYQNGSYGLLEKFNEKFSDKYGNGDSTACQCFATLVADQGDGEIMYTFKRKDKKKLKYNRHDYQCIYVIMADNDDEAVEHIIQGDGGISLYDELRENNKNIYILTKTITVYL